MFKNDIPFRIIRFVKLTQWIGFVQASRAFEYIRRREAIFFPKKGFDISFIFIIFYLSLVFEHGFTPSRMHPPGKRRTVRVVGQPITLPDGQFNALGCPELAKERRNGFLGRLKGILPFLDEYEPPANSAGGFFIGGGIVKKIRNVTVAIIAGGKSQRFGEPKALAKFGQQTLMDFSLQLARRLSRRIFVVSGNNEYHLPVGIKVYSDLLPERGPLGGIHTALFYSATPYLATLPCDMPLLSVRVYQILHQHLKAGRPVVAVSEKGWEPLVAIWPREALPIVEAYLMSEQLSLRNVLQALEVVEVSMPRHLTPYDPDIFFNINTKNDLNKLKHLTEKRNAYAS